MNSFDLDNVQMNVVQTAANGVVNHETIFSFSQQDVQVQASYSGGNIAKGFLIGVLKKEILNFSYCQLQTDGILDNGSSKAQLSITAEGKLRLTEHFDWKSRPGEIGINVFEQL
ncbi:hypothetical protein [Flagellimonas algicola]|uniref:Uncharacterized protein n=1 Tax=Flagellimonas algicola TaxID=2583815 RepID=A0ABY2WM85_9FLAO|nr:hypothetical protein [Allomuricauda algicola]TMU55988.1 hypothetical protein FGG15_00130 [Allomuricauda algicola]